VATEWTEYTNTTNHDVTLTLQDQSRVTLAPASRLNYPQHFTGTGRDVYLVGKGFFKVSHNPARPFQVHTEQLVTTVLGTSFTVKAFAGQEASVQVRTGKVRVTPLTAASADVPDKITAPIPASVVLRPNQQAVYSPAKVQMTKELVPEPAVLVEQTFAFDDRPVSEVLGALATAYGVEIVYDKAVFAHCTVTLKLTSESLYDKLDVVCKTLGASYAKAGTRIIVRGKPCKD
jgi:ferric-dicitrate binding protein FerR (iron transport regulator)